MYEITVQSDVFDNEIERLMNCLESLEPESKEYALILKATKTLESLKVEESKIQNEHARMRMEELKMEFEEGVRKLEDNMKEKHHEEDLDARSAEAAMRKRLDTIKLCVEIAGLVLPLIFCWTWMNKGLAFEETGVFTSSTFRSLFGRFTGMIG